MPAKSKALTSIQEEIKKQIQAVSQMVDSVSADRVRTEGTSFIAPDDSRTDELNVVILAFTTMRTYYDTPWDPNNINPPACFAVGEEPKNLVPSANSPDVQSESCAKCPMAQWGSGPTENSQACKTYRVLAVTPAGVADGPILQYRISATGLKSFDGYVRTVMSRHGTVPVGVETTITLNPVRNFTVPQLEVIGPNPHLEAHFGRIQEAKDLINTEPSVEAEKGNEAKTQPVRKKRTTKKRRSAVR